MEILTRQHHPRLRSGTCALLLAVATALIAAGADRAQAAVPSRADFAVQIDGGPESIAQVPKDIRPSLDSCKLSGSTPPVTVTCTFPYTFRSRQPLEGTIRGEDGRVGRFRLLCDWQIDTQVRANLEVDAAYRATSLRVGFSGAGDQPCSWTATFDGSSLTGTMSGRSVLGLIDGDTSPPATSASFTGTFDVTVVSGSGEFEGASGTGSFVQRERFDFAAKLPSLDSISALLATMRPTRPVGGGAGGPAAPPAGTSSADAAAKVQAAVQECVAKGLTFGTPAHDACVTEATGTKFTSGSGPSRSTRRTASSRAEEGSTLSVALRSGGGRAVAVVPSRLSASSPYTLHLAARRGSTCTMTASSRGRSVALGSVTDSDGDGSLIGKGRLAAKLGKGTWKLAAVCRSGGKVTTSTSSITIAG